MAGRYAFRPAVTLTGADQEPPSLDVATTALFAAHPGLNRQSCQRDPDAAGRIHVRGRKRKEAQPAERANLELGDDRGRPEGHCAVDETDEPSRLPDQR